MPVGGLLPAPVWASVWRPPCCVLGADLFIRAELEHAAQLGLRRALGGRFSDGGHDTPIDTRPIPCGRPEGEHMLLGGRGLSH